MTQTVYIRFQRVQTWLFEVPRLRAMVGANALLGEALRVGLPELARSTGQWVLAPAAAPCPGPDPRDPLTAHDDPGSDARSGILSRDGGHFEAQFDRGAEAFAAAAEEFLRATLPGLRFRISIDEAKRVGGQAHLSTELPVLAPCDWTGRGLASTVIAQGEDSPSVSLGVAARHEAAKRAERGRTKDLASLLSAKTLLNKLDPAQELKDLVGSGYLALIHADGNGLGHRAAQLDDIQRASFFHRNRVLLRCAVQQAINQVCEGETGRVPLVLLMLGGDDLLLVCRADLALRLVVTLCEVLAALQHDDASNFRLTLGVGVVVAKHSIPIHRLHEVAEQLAGSAKRRVRGLDASGDNARSVVDWAVYSTSWVDDPEDVRRREWLRGEGKDLRVLSQRPVDVLGEGLDTLAGLIRGAAKLAQAPRSQLRYLVEQLPRGHVLTDLAFEELSTETRAALLAAGVETPWRRTPPGAPSFTPLLDLVEIAEIARLGRHASARTAEAGPPAQERVHG